jgi:hypothetical protein
MITRKEYMDGSPWLHHAYHLEVAQEAGLLETLSPEILKQGAWNINADMRAHFNSLPLADFDRWGALHQGRIHRELSKRGDGYSLSAGATIGKAILRHKLKDTTPEAWWYADTIRWQECDVSEHDEMLGCLPPISRECAGFLVGEISTHRETGTQFPTALYQGYMVKRWGSEKAQAFKSSRAISISQFKGQMHLRWPQVENLLA